MNLFGSPGSALICLFYSIVYTCDCGFTRNQHLLHHRFLFAYILATKTYRPFVIYMCRHLRTCSVCGVVPRAAQSPGRRESRIPSRGLPDAFVGGPLACSFGRH